MGTIANIGAGLTTAHATAYAAVNTQIEYSGNTYQYVQYQASASVLAVAGSPLGFRTSAPNTVTTDISLSNSGALMGMAMCTFTSTNRFGWALVKGSLATAGVTAKTDTTVSQYHKLVWAADKVFDGIAAQATSVAFFNAGGYATAADSGSQLVSGRIDTMGGVPRA